MGTLSCRYRRKQVVLQSISVVNLEESKVKRKGEEYDEHRNKRF